MPRRAQLAFALIFLLVLAPLAGATCGIQCFAATPHHPSHAASAEHDCVRAVTCCYSSAPALCGAAQAPDVFPALLSSFSRTADVAASAAIAATFLPANIHCLAARSTDSSPPGERPTSCPTPIRI